MKKIILGIFTLFILQTANAQEPRGFSVLVGPNFGTLKTNDLKATPAGPGLFAGIGFNMGYHETYNYQMEIAYVQNTVNLEDSEGNNVKYNVGGLFQVGLYLNYFIIKPDEDKFYFGPQVGVYTSFGSFTSSTGSYTGDSYEPSGLSSLTLMDAAPFNYGAGFGLTGAYNKFRFNFRYNLGLSNVLRNVARPVEPGAYSSGETPFSGKVSSVSLTLSYRVFSRN